MQRPACHTDDSRESAWLRVAVVLPIVAALLVVLGLSGCTKSPVEKLIDESIGHLEAAHRMMVDNAGNIEKLGIAVVRYRSKHRGEFRKLRIAGEKALQATPEAERKVVMERARKRTLALKQKIEEAAGRYEDKRMAMRMVRPLMVTATPKGLAKGQRPPWLPKFPKMPAEEGGQAGAGGAHGPHHGHNHGPAPKPSPGHGLPPATTAVSAP